MFITEKNNFCGQCGGKLEGDERFCGECGAPNTSKVAETRATPALASSTSLPTSPTGTNTGQRNSVATDAVPLAYATTPANSTPRKPSRHTWLKWAAPAILCIASVAALAWFLPGWLFVPWEGAEQVKAIVPGETNLAQVAELFGEYNRVGTYGANLEVITFWPDLHSISEATVWLDRNRTVRCLRVTPSPPIPHRRFRKSFDYMQDWWDASSGNLMANGAEPFGETYHMLFARYIYVVDGDVLEYWHVDLESVDFDLNKILREIHNDNNQPLDVSGSGSAGYGIERQGTSRR